ncbi:MAG TPA: hypothetical protein VN631_03880 [Negativicutes bacterium]|nr:hypothetical protein [Negativicutes bacterium]
MKQRQTLCSLLAILMLLSATAVAGPLFGLPNPGEDTPTRENCRIYYLRVNDSEPPLNVRSSPEVKPDNVIATLPNYSFYQILAEQEGWFQIALALKIGAATGWVVANRTDYGCNFFHEMITAFPYTMQGKIFGPGSHNYILDLTKGQILVLQGDWPDFSGPGVSSKSREFPNRQYTWWRKSGDTTTPEPLEWRWTVTQSGRYKMSYDSNFKGFQYGPVW